jgi:hypothetical protein
MKEGGGPVPPVRMSAVEEEALVAIVVHEAASQLG